MPLQVFGFAFSAAVPAIRTDLFIWTSGPGCSAINRINHYLGRVVQSWVKITQVSARFEFRFESLESISVLILFVYKLMIGSSKNSTENYPRKCFWTQEKETWVKFNPGLSANRPSNKWALVDSIRKTNCAIHWIEIYSMDRVINL